MPTLTLKAQLHPTEAQASVLRDAMFCATKVYNGVLYHLREQAAAHFKATGEWAKTDLSDSRLNALMQANCPRRQALPSDAAAQVWRTLREAYKAFFALRKAGRTEHQAPGFKRKDTLSPLTYPRCNVPKAACFLRKQGGAYVLELRLGTRRQDGVRKLLIPCALPPHRHLPFNRIRQVEVLYDTNVGYTAHLSFDVDASACEGTQTVALDLGEKHLFAAHFSDGTELLVRGGHVRALRRYWQKVRRRVKSPSKDNPRLSKRFVQIARKESRQAEHALHIVSKRFVELCASKGVSRIVLGDLTGIRERMDFGAVANQKLHAWSFRKLTTFLTYKAALRGIAVEQVDEAYTSRTCSACGHVKASCNGRLYKCSECGFVHHRDLNGARNIFQRAAPVLSSAVARTEVNVSGDNAGSGLLASPAVVSWRPSWHTVCQPVSSKETAYTVV